MRARNVCSCWNPCQNSSKDGCCVLNRSFDKRRVVISRVGIASANQENTMMFKFEEEVWSVRCADYQQDIFKTFVDSVIKEKRNVCLAINCDEFCFLASEYYENVYYVTSVWDWEWNEENTSDEIFERLVYIAKQLHAKRFDVILNLFYDCVKEVVNESAQLKTN